MSIKNNYLALNLVYIFFFTSCTVTFNSIESYPKSKSYDKPLDVISYDYYTKYLHKRLERAFRNEFENQNYDASFIRIEQANKKFEIKNNQFPIYQVLKDSLPADSSDLLILIHPLGVVMQVPGMAIIKVNYQVFCIDNTNKQLIWRADLESQSYVSSNIDTKKTAKQILNRLKEDKILEKLILKD